MIHRPRMITVLLISLAAIFTLAPADQAPAAESCSASLVATPGGATLTKSWYEGVSGRLVTDCSGIFPFTVAFHQVLNYTGPPDVHFEVTFTATGLTQRIPLGLGAVPAVIPYPVGPLQTPGGDTIKWSANWISTDFASFVTLASSRIGKIVSLTGVVRHWDGVMQVPDVGRHVSLTRYINGWQTMLVITTDGAGKFSVSFVQPAVYQYQANVVPHTVLLVLAPSGTDPCCHFNWLEAAHSRSTFR